MTNPIQPAPTAATFTAQFDDDICALLRPCNESRRVDFHCLSRQTCCNQHNQPQTSWLSLS